MRPINPTTWHAALNIQCPSCGRALDTGGEQRFCGACGAPLPASGNTATSPAPAVAPARANTPRRTEAAGRFLNEVRMSLRVTHPNVCRVFDIGQIDERHFLSMEYVDGEDLASLLRRIRRLPEDKAVEIARQLCAGLAAAHDEGVLTRA